MDRGVTGNVSLPHTHASFAGLIICGETVNELNASRRCIKDDYVKNRKIISESPKDVDLGMYCSVRIDLPRYN